MAADATPSQETTSPHLPESETASNQLEISYLVAMTDDGGYIGGHYLAEKERKIEDFEHQKEKERDDFINALTLEETRRHLEEELADLNRKIEKNRRRMEEIDREIELLDQDLTKEKEKLITLKLEKDGLTREKEKLERQQEKIDEKLRHLEERVSEADANLVNALAGMTPEAEAAATSLMNTAKSYILVEAKIRNDPEDTARFHLIFQDENGKLYINHPSKGKTALSDLESANDGIDDLEKHARYQERFQNKKFLNANSADDRTLAEKYYGKYDEFLQHISMDEDTAKLAENFRIQHREVESDLYEYHKLYEEKLRIAEALQENKRQIEEKDRQIEEASRKIGEIEEQKKRLAAEKTELELKNREMEKRASEIEKELRKIDTKIKHQIETIERYGKIQTPDQFYETMAKEKYSGCMPTHGTPEDILAAARNFDGAIKDMALANVSASASRQAVAAYESRYDQIHALYGDDTSKMASAVITLENEKGVSSPVYRYNSKSGGFYTMNEAGEKIKITDVKTIASINLQAYVEGKLFANEESALSSGEIPSRMLSRDALEEWTQTPLKTAQKNIIHAAEKFGELTKAPEGAPAEGEPAHKGNDASLSGKFNNRAEGNPPEDPTSTPVTPAPAPKNMSLGATG